MAKLTMVFGGLLVILGIAGFVMTGSAHPTALIPVWFGLVLGLAGKLAKSEDEKKRMLWMHIAVTVGLLGFLASAGRATAVWVKAHGAPLQYPAAMAANIAMALLCGVYVVLCVRSLIAARKARG